MTDYTNNAFGIDVSHYDPLLHLDKLKGYIDFLIAKMGGSEPNQNDVRFAEKPNLNER